MSATHAATVADAVAQEEKSWQGLENVIDDVIAEASSSTPWPEIHQREYERAGLEYKPCTRNEFAIVYHHNAFYRSLPPRCRECVLFFDQTRPMTEIDAERYPSIDLHDP